MNEIDFMKPIKNLSISDQFNCLLVYKGKRPAYLCGIDKLETIKKHYSFLQTTTDEHNSHVSVFVHLNKLPLRKKNETKIHYYGRVLGYSLPLDSMLITQKWKTSILIEYFLIVENTEHLLHTEVLHYKNQFVNKLKDYKEVAHKINSDVGICVRKKYLNFPIHLAKNTKNKHGAFISTKLDPNTNIQNYAILFNLALVFYGSRKAYYPMEFREYLTGGDIEKVFPNMFIYTPIKDYFIVSCEILNDMPLAYHPKEMPRHFFLNDMPLAWYHAEPEAHIIRHKRRGIPENLDDEVSPNVSVMDMYLGELLGYSCPGEMIDRVNYAGISYYINGVLFLSEICRDIKNIKDKTEEYKKIAEKLKWKLTSEITQHNSLKTGLIYKYTRDFDEKLKNKMTQILSGDITEFEWNNKKDLQKIKDLKKFVKVVKNKVIVL